jgi:hypothetical protein
MKLRYRTHENLKLNIYRNVLNCSVLFCSEHFCCFLFFLTSSIVIRIIFLCPNMMTSIANLPMSYPISLLFVIVLSCPVLSCPILSSLVQSYLLLPYPIFSCPVLFCPVLCLLSYPTLSVTALCLASYYLWETLLSYLTT